MLEQDLRVDRAGAIGASDAGAIYNLDWGCRRRLVYRVRGVEQDFPQAITPMMERGTFMEPVVRALYAAKTRRKLTHLGVLCHPGRSWMIAHQDDTAESAERDSIGTVEYKVIHWRTMKTFKKEGIRESIILQMQHSLAITGHTWGSIGLLCVEPWEFAWFDVERDEALIYKYLADLDELWGFVQNGPFPEALPPTDKRCQTCPWRRTCQGELLAQSIPQKGEGRAEQLEPDASLLPLATELKERQELLDEATELCDETKGQLREKIGEKPGATFPGGRVILSRFASTRWDTKALGELIKDPDLAMLLAKYRKTSEGSTLRVYWGE